MYSHCALPNLNFDPNQFGAFTAKHGLCYLWIWRHRSTHLSSVTPPSPLKNYLMEFSQNLYFIFPLYTLHFRFRSISIWRFHIANVDFCHFLIWGMSTNLLSITPAALNRISGILLHIPILNLLFHNLIHNNLEVRRCILFNGGIQWTLLTVFF